MANFDYIGALSRTSLTAVGGGNLVLVGQRDQMPYLRRDLGFRKRCELSQELTHRIDGQSR